MSKVIVCSYSPYENKSKIQTKLVDKFDESVLKDWEVVGENMWCLENDVVVVGDSESECIEKLKKFDEETIKNPEYVKVEGTNMLDFLVYSVY